MADIGQMLGDRYEVLKEIGRGGMSRVYLTEDRETGKKWAAKEMSGLAEETKSRILAEARLLQSLDHPMIPAVENVIEEESVTYVVMEYLPGTTARDLVREKGKLPYSTALRIGIQLCEVLAYLHTLPDPVLFRDVKPGNIMLLGQDPPEIRLLDFGIARPLSQEDHSNYEGTLGFSAPEQFIRDRPEDVRTDIFGIGATIFYLVTGKFIKGDSSLLSEKSWNGIPAASLRKILLKCTREKPEERYSSCEELKESLQQCLALAMQPGAASMFLDAEPDENVSENIRPDDTAQTARLEPTVSLERENQQTLSPAEEARRKLQFRPLREILVCGTDEGL